uniref:Uncharacterized protein n=1 Tax=Anopheles darlingi TaxID=43151 RepID=A0A2M4D4S8_ANODA
MSPSPPSNRPLSTVVVVAVVVIVVVDVGGSDEVEDDSTLLSNRLLSPSLTILLINLCISASFSRMIFAYSSISRSTQGNRITSACRPDHPAASATHCSDRHRPIRWWWSVSGSRTSAGGL